MSYCLKKKVKLRYRVMEEDIQCQTLASTQVWHRYTNMHTYIQTV